MGSSFCGPPPFGLGEDMLNPDREDTKNNRTTEEDNSNLKDNS